METKYNSLELTKAERDAIDIYINYKHFDINFMLNDDISKTIEDNRGRYIDNSIENIKNNIKIIENLYAAMYKYMKVHGNIKTKLFRGASEKELSDLGKSSEYINILSTTPDKNIAMDFFEYKKGGIIEIKANEDIPYIVPNNVLSNNNNDKNNEKEYIISPFCTIDNFQKTTEVPTNTYDMTISKQNLPNISISEIKNCLQIIENNIDKLSILTTEYENLSNEYDSLNSMLSPKQKIAKDDLEQMWDKKIKIANRISNISKEYKDIKVPLISYVKNCCKEKEHDIENNIKTDMETINQKEKEKNQAIITDLKRLETNKYDKLIYESKQCNKNFDKTTDICKQIADEFGINYIPGLSKEEHKQYIENINNKLYNIKGQLDNIFIDNDDLPEDISNKILNLKNLNLQLETIHKVLDQVKELTGIYKEDSLNIIKSEILDIVNTSIMSDRMKKLNHSECGLRNTKIGIIDKLTGKGKLNKAKLEQIQLRKDLLMFTGTVCKSNNINDMLEYMDEYVKFECYGNCPENINLIRSSITTCFNIKDINSIGSCSINKDTQMVSIDDNDILGFIRNKTTYNIVSTQNIDLKEMLGEFRNNKSSVLHENLSNSTNCNVKNIFTKIITDLSRDIYSNDSKKTENTHLSQQI